MDGVDDVDAAVDEVIQKLEEVVDPLTLAEYVEVLDRVVGEFKSRLRAAQDDLNRED